MEKTRVEALRRRVQQERDASGDRPRFSKSLEQEVMELLKSSGWSQRRVSKELGLSESSIQRWVKRHPPRTTTKRDAPKAKFIKATLIEPNVARTDPPMAGALCLELPCGARVTGLTISQVAELMRRQP